MPVCISRRHASLIAATAATLLTAPNIQARISPVLRPLTVHDAIHIKTLFHEPSLSSDGRWLAYAPQDSSAAEHHPLLGGINSEIFITVLDLETNQRFKLGSNDSVNIFPLWSPDSSRLAYFSNRDGEWKLRIWDSGTGKDTEGSAAELYPLQPTQYGPNLIWTPDSKRVVTRLVSAVSTRRPFTHDVPNPAQQKKRIEVLVNHATSSKKPSASTETNNFTDAIKERAFDLAVIELSSGEVHVLAENVAGIGDMSVSPNGCHLVYTEAVLSDKSFLRDMLSFNLKSIPIVGGKPHTIAHDINTLVTQATRWSPDGARLVFSTSAAQGAGFIVKGEGAYLVSAVDESEPILLAAGVFSDVQWSSNGSELLLVGDALPKPAVPGLLQDNSRDVSMGLWKFTLETKKLKEVTPRNWNRSVRRLLHNPDRNTYWSPDDGRSALIHVRDDIRYREGFFKISLSSGKMQALMEADKIFMPFAISKDGATFVYGAQDNRHPPDLWVLSDNLRQPARQVTHLNPQLDRYAFGETRLIRYRSSGRGEELLGALFLPAGYVAAQRYPLITEIYPRNRSTGPMNLHRFDFAGNYAAHPTAQLYTTRGYAVLYPAVPTYVGTPMRNMADAILPAVDQVVELGVGDADRLGIRGHSYGGHATIAMLVQSTRFKAAVMSAGFANVIGQSLMLGGDGDVPGGIDWALGSGMIGATLWERRDRYIENSPIFYLNRVETPLLILHGKKDTSVPYWLADEVFAGLKILGKEVEYRRYVDESHVLEKEENVVDALDATLRWFDNHLKPSGTVTAPK